MQLMQPYVLHAQVVTGFYLSGWRADVGPEEWAKRVDEVIQMLVDNTISPLAGKSFPLEKASEAVIEATKRARGGKVFITG